VSQHERQNFHFFVKHSTETSKRRGLKELNIALGDLLRQSEERAGVPYEEFEKRFQESLLAAREGGPDHDWHQGVAKEIEETIDELNLLENLRAKPLN